MRKILKRDWLLWIGLVVAVLLCSIVIAYYYYFFFPINGKLYDLNSNDLWVLMSVGLVGLTTALFPLVLNSYRQVSINEHLREFHDWTAEEVEEVFGLSIKLYIIPMYMLSAMILFIGLGMIVFDLVSDYGPGAAWILMGDYTFIPTSAIEWAYAGAVIYILQDMMRRYIARDLTPRFYFLGFTRILLAIVISIIIFGIIQASPLNVFDIEYEFNEELNEGYFSISESRDYAPYLLFAVFFMVGFYPQRFFTLARNWVVSWLSKIFNFKAVSLNDSSISLLLIDGISQEIEARLKEEGIYGAQNLAYTDLALLAEKTPYGLALLVDWKDQAALLTSLGSENVEDRGKNGSALETLKKFGFTRYSDLYYLARLKEKDDTYQSLKEMLKPMGLLEMLRRRGKMIDRGLREESMNDLRVASFSTWQVSPADIKLLLNEK